MSSLLCHDSTNYDTTIDLQERDRTTLHWLGVGGAVFLLIRIIQERFGGFVDHLTAGLHPGRATERHIFHYYNTLEGKSMGWAVALT